ncbi:MAG: tetratricopeptide (TPR) repeat protein [Cyclobacteriaceae bacterium]
MDTAGSDLADNPMDVALASFAKYEEMEDEDKEETLISDAGIFTYTQLIDTYYLHYFNLGATAYTEQDYAKAIAEFGNSSKIRPDDTTAYLYIGYAASNAENYEVAKVNYAKAISLGITTKDPYNLLAYIYDKIDEDYEKGLEVVRLAAKQFPDDNDFRRSEIQFLFQLDKLDEAMVNLETAIENEPNDPALRFTLGSMYDNLSESEEDTAKVEELLNKALAAYIGATEVDPTYLNAYYNIGVMMITKANEIIKESNNLGFSKADLKKADALEPLINERLKAALPAWEKVNEIEPDNRKTLETLQYLYTQLKMMDKAEAVMNQIDDLE